jgi:hypothetical protein
MLQPSGTTIIQRPKRRHDDDLSALCDEFTKGFGKGKVPADEHADFTQRRVEDFVGVAPAAG